MPTYTYKCTNKDCTSFDIAWDVKQKMSDDKLVHCPSCQQDTLSKVIGTTEILFMGDGWSSNINKGIHHMSGKEKGYKQ